MKGTFVLTILVALGVSACGRDGGGGGIECVDFGVAAGCYCQAGGVELPDDQIGEERGTCSEFEFVPDTQCCARSDWGADEQMFDSEPYCACSALRCGDNGFGDCTCTFNPFSEIPVGQTTCTPPEGGVCCVDDLGFCTCSESTSCGSSLQVGQCDATALACTSDDIAVATCDTLGEEGGGGDDGPPPL